MEVGGITDGAEAGIGRPLRPAATDTAGVSRSHGALLAAWTPTHRALLRGTHPEEGCVQWERVAPLAAECCGAFLLTFTFVCNSSSGDPTFALTSNAFMAGVTVYATGHVSGGNINPSVSIALCLAGRQSAWVTAQLCSVQLFGGICAGALCHFLGKGAIVELGPREGFNWPEAMLVEILYTAMICFVFLNCAASRGNNPLHKANGFVGLATIFCFVAGGYGAAAISGTVMNPAIALGMQLVDLFDGRPELWGAAYLPFEVAGACLAAGSYRLVRPGEFNNRQSQRWTPDAQAAIFQQTPVSSRLSAEFIGTFYVVFTKALNNLGKSRAEAWSVGAAYGCMAYALRGVSGGHFNPAVSFAAALSGRQLCPPLDCVRYMAVQLWAGVVASSVYAFIHHGASINVDERVKYGMLSSALGEMLFTFLLAYVNLTTATVMLGGAKSNAGGLAVAFAAVVGGLSIESISGAVMNPAMALGFSGLNSLGQYHHPCFYYVPCEMAGALLAAGVFLLTHGQFLWRCLHDGDDDDDDMKSFESYERSQRARL